MNNNIDGVGAFLILMFISYCVIFTIISNVSTFFNNSKLINTGKTKHIVETTETNTFRVYSSIRTIKVK